MNQTTEIKAQYLPIELTLYGEKVVARKFDACFTKHVVTIEKPDGEVRSARDFWIPEAECELSLTLKFFGRDATRAGHVLQKILDGVPESPVIHEASRREDMSPDGKLTLYRQEDGDIVVVVRAPDRTGETTQASVEFCTSGGRSHHTRVALVELMAAMQKDNEERTI